MPSIPEYYNKIDELLFFIDDYSNVFPYHPNNAEIEYVINKRILKLIDEIVPMISTCSDDFKKYFWSIKSRFISLEQRWDLEEENWNR
jgi:hypothetical protein